MSDPIEKLEAKVQEARAALRAAERELREAQLEAAPFKAGDVVEARKRYMTSPWRRARVVSVRFWQSEPNYIVTFANKGGEWSKQRTDYVEVRKLEETPDV